MADSHPRKDGTPRHDCSTLWLSFYPFSQEQYLEICAHWLHVFGEDFAGRQK